MRSKELPLQWFACVNVGGNFWTFPLARAKTRSLVFGRLESFDLDLTGNAMMHDYRDGLASL